MHLSQRILDVVGESKDDGWSVHYDAWQMAARGEAVIMLTVGDHDVRTDASILDAMQAAMTGGYLGYSPVAGSKDLRQAVAARAEATGLGPTSADQVVVTPGGQAALFGAMMAALDPGQSCVVLDPYYATYLQTVRAASGRPVVVATRAAEGFQPDPDLIAAALAPDTRAILINSPNNPSGAVYARDRLEGLAALCRERGLWLISDEVYDSQVHLGSHLSPRALPGMAERTLVVNSLSKSHAMTGSRLGWVIAPAEAAARLTELATTTTYGIPGFIQQAGLFALTQGAEIEAEICARYAARRALVLEALANTENMLPAFAPAGGMYLMLDIRATGLSGLAFAERLLAEERIAVMPGESFGDAAAGHVRVALTVPDEALTEAFRRIVAFAERLTAAREAARTDARAGAGS